MSYSQLSVDDITRLYLYGSTALPELDTSSRIRSDTATSTIDFDVNAYMTTGAGRFAIGSQFELVDRFFADNTLTPGSYSKEDLRAAYGMAYIGLDFQQYNYADGNDDYVERVWTWNSSAFKIDDGAVFVVDPDGSHHIENFAVVPVGPENFDFISSDPLASLAADYSTTRIDPSQIGRTVNINFAGTITTTDYDHADYANDIMTSSNWQLFSALNIPKLLGIFDDLFDSGTTKFEKDGLAIQYGSFGDDQIPTSFIDNHPYLGQFTSNGQIIYTGPGDDVVLGDTVGDEFRIYGGDGTDAADFSAMDHGIHLFLSSVEEAYTTDYNDYVKIDEDSLNGQIDAGEGSDTFSFEVFEHGISVFLDDGTSQHVGGLTLSNFEDYKGSDYADTMIGLAGRQIIDGRAGADILEGGDGADTLRGDGDDDADIIDGGADSDLIIAEKNDIIHGGAGADKIEYTSGSSEDQHAIDIWGGAGNDYISALGEFSGYDTFARLHFTRGDGNDVLSFGTTDYGAHHSSIMELVLDGVLMGEVHIVYEIIGIQEFPDVGPEFSRPLAKIALVIDDTGDSLYFGLGNADGNPTDGYGVQNVAMPSIQFADGSWEDWMTLSWAGRVTPGTIPASWTSAPDDWAAGFLG